MSWTVQKAKDFFPDTLRKLLKFEETEDCIVIRPHQYLGRETFANIARIVREGGGEYISAGKQSHFRFPKEAAEEGKKPDAHERMQQALDHIKEAGRLLTEALDVKG